jgi:hypothetical protein
MSNFDQLSQNASLEINITTKEGFACGCTSTFVNFICLGWFFHLSSLSLCLPSALCAWVLSYLFCSCFPPDCHSSARNGNDVLVSLDGRCSGFIGIGIVFTSILTVSIRYLIRRTWRLASIGTVSIRYLIMPTMLSTALRVVSIRSLRMQHRG